MCDKIQEFDFLPDVFASVSYGVLELYLEWHSPNNVKSIWNFSSVAFASGISPGHSDSVTSTSFVANLLDILSLHFIWQEQKIHVNEY